MPAADYLPTELRRVALTRALRDVSPGSLPDGATRARAYLAAGLSTWSCADDAEAVRRTDLFYAHVATAAPALSLFGVAA